ncbi:MAG TPA: 30S ribosomal protein S17 [Patescibacteria group bacterium]|nr:30S ribosomal protein S17 [Patescibacteria group bacterium]
MARIITGIVSSDKANKSIVVKVTTRKTHPLYRKQYSTNAKFMAHDEKNEAQIGDTVSIIECRPLSAKKRFKLNKIIERPTITQDKLEVVKTDDTNKRATKSKVKEDEVELTEDKKK